MKKKSSIQFYFACSIIVFIVGLAAIGGMIKPHGFMNADKLYLITKIIDGKTIYETPPLRPNATYLLGTDHRGFDMLSLLLNGLKYTLAYAALLTGLRFIIAMPLGMWSGTTGRGGGVLRTMQWVISAVPAFLFLYPPLVGMYFKLGLNEVDKANPHNLMQFTIIFIFMVTVLGIFPLAYQIAERARFYNSKPYVDASRLMGGSSFHRIVRHIFSNMRVELLYIAISEFIIVLFLMGQLAIFNIIIGGSETLDMVDKLVPGEVPYLIYLTTTGEWTSLIAYGAKYIQVYPFIVIDSGIAFALLILSLQFFLYQFKKRTR
ncbi:ABC transporter permease subunit [Paenibacillus qinlingensis]|uniref:ABC transporter permease subunit n=1 Tax=Paenibacillus qinlingensis TaxID=1837343 RepID=UPI001563922A|nr:ABC transporter permease subunit [Paenibacillus qinlingensis]NQX60633.1 ABC transporter permease subunit [Paenibacillus qinlingensis]